ncbi:hypothetical protein PHMEG_0009093 [Phytophthora megakarya]|uniref:Uncharacterized protein n=1 Tax=Phytophthora megakarya TaxID=4795 RepID=A0A225WHD5_9STRA|nr:hypothetical protein PHMEG_0009093 [Phytophthora megakarya]
MSKLSLVKNFAEFATTNDLHPVKRNITRWSSRFEILEHYVRIRPQIRTIEAVEELVRTGAAHRKLLVLLEHMKKRQSLMMKLQMRWHRFAGYPPTFDTVISEYPTTPTVKAINGGTLSKVEAVAVKLFKVAKCGDKRMTRQDDYATQRLLTGCRSCQLQSAVEGAAVDFECM